MCLFVRLSNLAACKSVIAVNEREGTVVGVKYSCRIGLGRLQQIFWFSGKFTTKYHLCIF